MGWASGSGILDDVWSAVYTHIPKKQRVKVARELIRIFESYDCDTLEECNDGAEMSEALRLEGYTLSFEDENG